jgi:PHD/YefM family antitoxin component YafN of YafNO toxin-antitoxin module
MDWRIAEAKQRFSELIQAVSREPQRIYNRDQLVAVVVKAEVFQEFVNWQNTKHQMTLAEQFSELRQICREENYSLEVPVRENRPNLFEEDSDVSV